jgi:hypothetical protein
MFTSFLDKLHTQFEILIKYVVQHFPCAANAQWSNNSNSDSIFHGLKDSAVRKSYQTLG